MPLGVSDARCVVAFKRMHCPSADTRTLVMGAVLRELEYLPTLRMLHVNATLRVAIDRYQCARMLQARFVSAMKTDAVSLFSAFSPALLSPIDQRSALSVLA